MNYCLSSAMLFAFYVSVAFGQSQPPCPIAPTQVTVRVVPDVKYDKSTQIYTYTYKVENDRNSALPVDRFYLLIKEAPQSIVDPEFWVAEYQSDVPGIPNRIGWSTTSEAIAKNQSTSIFSFKSKHAPGAVRYLVYGDSDIPTVVPDETSDEPAPNCPGFFYDVPWAERFVTGVTTGPVANDQVSAILKIGKITEKNHRQCMHVSHKDKSRVKVTVYGSDTLNVADIDISSLKFGPGEAKPLNTKIIPFEDDDEHEKPRDGKKAIKQPKMLRMEFSIVDLKLRCNLDHALFLTGKVGAKNLFGGVEVAPDVCTTLNVRKPPRKLKKEKI